MTLLLAAGQMLPATRFFAGPQPYLALHTSLEVVSIVVSGMVFALAWNLREQAANRSRLALGAAFLAVGLIDLAHTLSFAGMPALVTPSDPEKAINFWLAGRAVVALALLAVAVRPQWQWPPRRTVALALALAAVVWWVGLWHAEELPRTFVAGQGLTAFKVAAEVVLAALYAAAAGLLLRRGRRERSDDLQWLGAAAWVQALAEMFFTLYADVTDVFNLLGHVYKAVSYLMVYRALFVSGVQQPFRELDLERAKLQALVAAIPIPVWVKNTEGVYLSCNAAFEALRGLSRSRILGRSDFELVSRELAEIFRASDRSAIDAGQSTRYEEWLTIGGGEQRGLFEVTKTPLRDGHGGFVGVLGLAHDITRLRALQHALQERPKEHDCLHDVFRLTEDTHGPLPEQLQAVALRLPAGWQVPERTAARLVLRGREYCSNAFVETVNCQRATIPIADGDHGSITVCVQADGEPRDDFLPEEQQLLDAVAARLASVLEQRRVRTSLLEREAIFGAIASQAVDSIALIDQLSGRFVEFNDAAARNLGYTREELSAKTLAEVDAAQDAQSLRDSYRALVSSGSLVFETRHRCKDGTLRDVLVRSRLVELGERCYLATIWSDITERNRSELLLRESEQHFRNLANAGSALIWASGLDQQFNYFNDPWLRFTGRTPEQESGMGWTEGVHRDDLARLSSAYRGAFAHQVSFSIEHRLRSADGGYRWLRNDGSPRFDSQGHFLGYIGHCVDVTEQKLSAAELERYRQRLEELVDERTRELALAKEAAEAATVAKSIFLANMSHEIRTPLNAVMGMAHLVRRSGVTPEQAERLGRIDAAGEHLLSIINDVLDLSKIEAGKFTLERQAVNVATIVGNVMSMLAERAQAKGLELVTELHELPHSLVGDPTRLRQALLNYAANAIKFTAAGRVTLRVQVQHDEGQAVLLRFEVQDTGSGIAADALPRLFSAFEQADASTTRRYGGTGLGLALTQRLARAMQGDAGATSTLGVGSLFWFTARLLRGAPPPPPALPRSARSAEQALRQHHGGRRVLVAEDEPVNREVAKSLLAEAGLDVVCVDNGAEAVERMRRERFDLILMDMQMPGVDGLEATRRIRTLPGGVAVPILAFTANAFAEDKERCIEAGMNDVVTKPLEPELLFSAMLDWLEASATKRGDAPPAGEH